MNHQNRRAAILVCGLLTLVSVVSVAGEAANETNPQERATTIGDLTSNRERPAKKTEKIVKTDAEWRKQLSRKQFAVTRRGDTERARTGRYWRHKAKGTYLCVCCDLPLFPSSTKYASGTGWPSFYAPLNKDHVATKIDRKLLYARTEVLCQRCDAHLGHVFSDGPRPTGLRYCLNSAALNFEPLKKETEQAGPQEPSEKAPSTSSQAAGKAESEARTD